MNKKQHKYFVRLLLILFIILFTVFLVYYRDKIKSFGIYGYPGIFILSFLANATLIFPLPGVIMTSAFGMVFNPAGVAIAAASGASLGELTGYAAGYSGSFVVENKEWYDRVKEWMTKSGEVIVFTMAIIPNPLFDLAGIAAGTLKMPLIKFLAWCWLGKLLKMLLFAYTGKTLLTLFSSLFQ